jgi:L-alanine-DL-glutamate epimerase-like enolase superfamily enzyme
MKIVGIKRTPLLCRLKQDYHWAQGLTLWSQVILIEIETDAGIVGIAESGAGPSFVPMLSILDDAIPYFIGKSVFDGNKLIWDFHREAFRARDRRPQLLYADHDGHRACAVGRHR